MDRPVDVPPLALDDPAAHLAPIPPPRGPSTGMQVAFHAIGVVLLVGAGAVAFVAWVVVSFGHSVCSANEADPHLVGLYRRDTALVFLALALVPAGWALLCKLCRFAWVPWVLVAAAVVAGGGVIVASIREVGTWCF